MLRARGTARQGWGSSGEVCESPGKVGAGVLSYGAEGKPALRRGMECCGGVGRQVPELCRRHHTWLPHCPAWEHLVEEVWFSLSLIHLFSFLLLCFQGENLYSLGEILYGKSFVSCWQ